MSTNVGDQALGGVSEYIMNFRFEITEEMTMEFKGVSCNITKPNDLDEELGPDDGQVTRKVYPGYRCYVMRAVVSFHKAAQT